MTELELKLEAERANWLSGETPRFSVVLTNGGTTPVQVPTPASGGFFTVFLSDPSGEQPKLYTQGLPSRLRRPDSRPLPSLFRETALAPGEASRYAIDLDAYAPELPKVGSYKLKVLLRTESLNVESKPLDFLVKPLRPVSMRSITDCENQLLRQLVLHEEQSGRVLLVRESVPGHPSANGFHRLAEELAPGASGAVALPLRPLLNAGPAAALSGGVLRIGPSDSALTLTQPIELTEATLHPFGWQIDDDTAEFLILGKQGDIVRALFVRFEEGNPVSTESVDLPLKAVPALWCARRLAHEASWTLVYGTGSTLNRLQLKRGGASGPTPLLDERGPMLALAMYPIAAASPEAVAALTEDEPNYSSVAPTATVDCVFGPFEEEDKSYFVLRRVDPKTAREVDQVRFLRPIDVPVEGLNWNLSQVTAPTPSASVLVGEQLQGIDTAGAMRVLADQMSGTRGHTLDWFGSAYVLGWVSREGDPVFRAMK